MALKILNPSDFCTMVRDATPLEWSNICEKYDLTHYIHRFEDKVDWENVSVFQKLSVEMLEKYIDRLDLDYAAKYQRMPEWFIEKYSPRLNWKFVSANQTMSIQFMKAHMEKIDWNEIYDRGCYFHASEMLEQIPHEYLGEELIASLNECLAEEAANAEED